MTERHRAGGGPPAAWTRRRAAAAAAAAASLLGGTGAARAQGRGPDGRAPGAAAPPAAAAAPPAETVVLALPVPCGRHPGDICGVLLEGMGSPAGLVFVFGQAFRPGDLPRGARLAARSADTGQALRAQLDVPTRHPDGSARFGVVSLQLPVALSPGARLGVVLSAAPAGGGPEPGPFDLAAALEGRRAVLELTPQPGAAPWSVDLLAALARAARSGAGAGDRAWQRGPLAVQVRTTAPVPPAAVGGVTSMRLVADVAARADGTVWVDAWLRNDAAMRPGGGTARYAARLFLDGAEALSAPALRQFQYTGWGRQLAAARGGRPAPPQPYLRPDAEYLAETGAVPRYDLTTGVAEALLARWAAAMRDPGWAAPLGPREITQGMPMTGGRPDIGPMTWSQAAWLSTGDPRAAAYAVGQAEAAGSVPWHMWDPADGPDGAWLNVRRWPRLWVDERGGPPPGGLLQQVAPPDQTGWQPDQPHQPDLSFVPYLMTGRRAFLDELLAQAAWNVMHFYPVPRNAAGSAGGPAQDAIMMQDAEVRGAAWALRQLDEAAWMAPDDDPQRRYFAGVVEGNWAWLRARIPEWTAQQGEAHGWIPGISSREPGGMGPWQQDYFASTAAAAARRGSADARAVLAWMSNFLVGRFLAGGRGFPLNDGIAYSIAVAPEAPRNAPPFRTWAEVGAATRARGMSNGAGWTFSEADYGQLALQSLAQISDVLGLPSAREAYARLSAADPPYTRPGGFARWVNYNIVPRGVRRVPSRAADVACRPAAAPRA